MLEVIIVGGLVVGFVALVDCVGKIEKRLQKQIDKLNKENHELRIRMINVEGKTNVHHIELTAADFKTAMNEINIDAIGRNLDRLLEKMDKFDKGEKYEEEIIVNASPEVLAKLCDDVFKKMDQLNKQEARKEGAK